MNLIVKIALFSLPLFFWPNPFKFELPKIILFLGLSFLLVICFLIKKKKLPQFNKFWFLWIFFLLLGSLVNHRFLPGMIGDGYRHQGLVFFSALGLWSVAFGQVKINARPLWRWISLGIMLQSFIVLTQWLISPQSRPAGTLGEPNAVAGFLTIGLPILASQLSFFLIIPVILAILATGSKTALLGIMAQGLVFAFFKLKSLPAKKFFVIFGLMTILAVGIFGVYQEREESLFENRWLIWQLGLKAALEKPLLGYGAEGIISAYDQQYQKIDRSLMDLIIDRSHNLFLDVFLFSGLLGLLFFAYWFWAGVTRIKENWRLISFVGFLIYSFFQPLGVVHWFYLIFLLT